MREDEIQRYGRQILLRELGGRGQRKLMETTVRVAGQSAAMESAVTYLRAGGTPIDDAGSVALITRSTTAPANQATVVLGDGVVWKTADACPECFAKTLALLTEASASPVVLGSLAALTVQRLVLGWADPLGAALWDGNRLQNRAPERCSQHSAP